MKPTGPIPPDFSASEGQLVIGGQSVREILDGAETPLFVYDGGVVRARVARLRATMPEGLGIHYAVKANPYRPLLAMLGDLVDGFDVASRGEMILAAEAGMDTEAISFAGPGKRDAELEAAVRHRVTVNVESEGEATRLLAIGARIGVTPCAAVRINPDFDLKGSGLRMGGGAKQFGVDAEVAAPLIRRLVDAGVDYRGLHIFAGSQALDAGAVAETQRQTVELAGRLSEEACVAPPRVNLGGGFGVPYFAGDKPLDVEAVGAALGDVLAARVEVLKGTAFAIELGRWLVAEAGVYLTRVIDRKESRGETFLVVDGGLNHVLAASGNFGTVVRRNYPIAVAGWFGAAAEEVVSVVGPLCTPLDRLGDRVELPRAEAGDVIALFMTGAYGRSASPEGFLSHPAAGEMLVRG
ncbi:pyridoxal-dependent decarboxylase, exosortase A system-associated [Sphingomonas sp. ID0503]|uniref:pyridoxal-dependent decarboxylase, exosortase A system-associated n=1 Tax=Sphingomonas sp. ID0503 TaxID=3399691 RepID=UPI003AFA5DE7